MERLFFIAAFALLLATHPAAAQGTRPFVLDRYSANITFVAMDSLHNAQSIVIEYPDYLVLLELPFVDAGADKSTGLYEDVPKAEKFIALLKQRYPRKPVKYVLSTHWHLHSLSGITPFFKLGAKLITTKGNWAYGVKNGLLGTQNAAAYAANIVAVGRDTTLLAHTQNPIRALFLDSTYQNKPTKDYLFFYFPRTKALFASCMCAVRDVDYSQLPFYAYSDRLLDLDQAIARRQLPVETIIKLDRVNQTGPTYVPPVYRYSYLKGVMKNGTPVQQLVAQYTRLSPATLTQQQDSLIHALIAAKRSPQILNQAVYVCLKKAEFNKAVALARLLNVYSPGDLNFVDTLGEAYFASGDVPAATFYNALLLQKQPDFKGGLKSWEQNKKTSSY